MSKINYVLTQEEAEKVEENLNLVRYIVKKYFHVQNADEFDELVQIGSIALIKAVKTYKINKNIVFATYAVKCIKNEILMFFRANQKHKNDTSLSALIATSVDGDEMLLSDILIDRKTSNFADDMENKRQIEMVISVILNCFPFKKKFVMLMSIAGLKQKEIAEFMLFSQAHVSRLCKKYFKNFEQDIKKLMNEKYKEVFKVTMNDTTIKITFSTTDVKNFNKVFGKFLLDMSQTERLIDFKVKCSKKQVDIFIPGEADSFVLLALLTKSLEDFEMQYETEPACETNPACKVQEQKNTENEELAEIGSENEEAVQEDINGNSAQEELEEKDEFKESEEELPSQGEEEQQPDESSNANLLEQNSKNKVPKEESAAAIKKYISLQEEFSTKDLKKVFPTRNAQIFNNVIISLIKKGQVIKIGRGQYKNVTSKKNKAFCQ